jgi:hypothetical protein
MKLIVPPFFLPEKETKNPFLKNQEEVFLKTLLIFQGACQGGFPHGYCLAGISTCPSTTFQRQCSQILLALAMKKGTERLLWLRRASPSATLDKKSDNRN